MVIIMVSYISRVEASRFGGWWLAQAERDVFGGKLLLGNFNFLAFGFVFFG